ncbi:MAG: polysaccharide deacetylase family protein [Acidimicrobiales bacterium]
MRRHRTVLACVVSTAVGFGGALVVRPRAPAEAGIRGDRPDPGAVISAIRTPQPLVALTLDDGPDPRWTPQVLAMLRQYHATATFFDVGRQAAAYPDLVRAELAAGNTVGDHTWSHADLQTLDPPEVAAELAKGADALRAAGAPAPDLFRPPYGYTDQAIGVLAAAAGYRTVFWTASVEHFVNHPPGVVGGVDELVEAIHPGTIILAHDGGVPDRTRTMQALPLLLSRLKARGYRVVDVDTLLGAASPPIPPLPPAAAIAP